MRDPQVVLKLRHILFGRPLLREPLWQHELGFKHGPGPLDNPIERRRHPVARLTTRKMPGTEQ